ncbi:hypothetical protein KIPB_007654, partial [Kipferlia bialata]|eukprot:g7654.t1
MPGSATHIPLQAAGNLPSRRHPRLPRKNRRSSECLNEKLSKDTLRDTFFIPANSRQSILGQAAVGSGPVVSETESTDGHMYMVYENQLVKATARGGRMANHHSWDLNKVKCTCLLAHHNDLWLGASDGSLTRFNLSATRETQSVAYTIKNAETRGVSRLAYASELRLLVSTGMDTNVKFWDLEPPSLLSTLNTEAPISDICVTKGMVPLPNEGLKGESREEEETIMWVMSGKNATVNMLIGKREDTGSISDIHMSRIASVKLGSEGTCATGPDYEGTGGVPMVMIGTSDGGVSIHHAVTGRELFQKGVYAMENRKAGAKSISSPVSSLLFMPQGETGVLWVASKAQQNAYALMLPKDLSKPWPIVKKVSAHHRGIVCLFRVGDGLGACDIDNYAMLWPSIHVSVCASPILHLALEPEAKQREVEEERERDSEKSATPVTPFTPTALRPSVPAMVFSPIEGMIANPPHPTIQRSRATTSANLSQESHVGSALSPTDRMTNMATPSCPVSKSTKEKRPANTKAPSSTMASRPAAREARKSEPPSPVRSTKGNGKTKNTPKSSLSAQLDRAAGAERGTNRDTMTSAAERFRSFNPSETVSVRSLLASITAMDTSDVATTLKQLNAYAPAAKGLTRLAGPLARFLRKYNPSLLSHENVAPLVSTFAPLHSDYTKCLAALETMSLVYSVDPVVATAKLKVWLEAAEAVVGLVPVSPPADKASLSLEGKQLVRAAMEFNQVVAQVSTAAKAILIHHEALSATASALRGIRPVAVSKAIALRAKVQHMAQQLQCRVE